ncbi:MAG: hypothetical protein JXA50_02145 [Deltaproteobacteria bacterium]|nr:hypothetical protein [Deltaproteobacteria bacterium]
MYFKLVMEAGHVGAGKSYEMVRYFQGDDIFGILANSRSIPRLKKKNYGGGIKLIKEISWREYLTGKGKESRDPYLNRSGMSAMVPSSADTSRFFS